MIVVRRALAEKRRILVPLALFAALNVVLYVVVVFPLGRQVKAAEAESRAQHEGLAAARLEYQSAKATVSAKQQADASLQQFYKETLPTDASVARMLTYSRLSQLAKQANVKLEHGNNTVTDEKGSTLSKLTTTYALSGEYRDVRKFIYSLETAPEFVVLENVALSSGGDPQARGLTMNIAIATYFKSSFKPAADVRR